MDIRELEIFKSAAYINGNWVNSTVGNSIEVLNPFDNSLIGTIPALAAEQVNEAIQSAFEAQISWKKQTIKYRSDLLKKWFELILKHQVELAQIMTVEQGKPLKEAKGEIIYAADRKSVV